MPLRRAAAVSATLPIKAAALALGSLGSIGRSLLGVCTADRPVGCDARRLNAAALALGSLGGTGRSPLGVCTADRPVGCDARRRSSVGNALHQRRCSRSPLLGVCTADRPVGCDARRRSCVGNALDQRRFAAPQLRRQRSRSKLLLSPSEAWAAQAARCSVSAPLIALSGVTLAAEAASATLSINAAALALGSLSGTGRSVLGVCTAHLPVGCAQLRRQRSR